MGDRLLPPPVLWAQRKNLLYVKVQLEDCTSPTIKVEKDSIYFKTVKPTNLMCVYTDKKSVAQEEVDSAGFKLGIGGTDKKEYEVTLGFFKEIKPEESKYSVRDRATEFVLIKAEEGYWKRLLKEDTKFHWLKVDFNKWKDEDDSEDDAEGTDFEEMMRKMGGMNDGGDLNYDDGAVDSDDEELPDLE